MKQATERPKKVVFFITKATWGGAQKYVFDLATSLPERFVPEVIYGTDGRLSAALKTAGISTHHLATLGRDIAPLSDWRSFVELWKLLRKIRPDTLHLNSSKAAALGALAGRLAGVPRIVFTAHGWPFKEPRSTTSRMLIFLISWLTTLLSSTTVVVSKEDETLGKRMPLVARKIIYVPLALKENDILSRPEAEQAVYRNHIGNSEDKKRIRLVTVAELTKNKGLSFAIEMLAELEKRKTHSYSYTIIGEGEELSALQKLVAERNVTDAVTFLSTSSSTPTDIRTNAARYLKAFDIFVLPSIKEGMPYVLLEAAAAGLPIIATEVVRQEASGLPEINFVPAKDAVSLADAVEQLAGLPKKEDAGIARSFERMLSQTQTLY